MGKDERGYIVLETISAFLLFTLLVIAILSIISIVNWLRLIDAVGLLLGP